MRIAQLVERPTEKTAAKLRWVRFLIAARDFSPTVSFHSRLSYGVRTMQLHASKSVGTLKITNTGCHIPLLGHTKILHTLVRMGTAAHVAAVLPYPGKATRISRNGQWNTEKDSCGFSTEELKFCVRATYSGFSTEGN